MIAADRTVASEPEILTKSFTTGDDDPETEYDRVIAAYEEHCKTTPAEPFRYEFTRYKHQEVRQALEAMFHGKCAYCEQRYAALQPMDVEHWRPKGRADFEVITPPNEHGYYWLTATWDNLLPSCIDCNRQRNHLNPDTGERTALGKSDKFPLAEGSVPQRTHESPGKETELLLDPSESGFDPRAHFTYSDDGYMAPTASSTRAEDSIRVYGLNRPALVAERAAMVRVLDHRLNAVAELSILLAEARVEFSDDELHPNRLLLESLHAAEMNAIEAMAQPEHPFAGMIRYLLRVRVPHLSFESLE